MNNIRMQQMIASAKRNVQRNLGMTKVQRDLLAACWNKKIKPTYDAVRGYAYNFKKYDNMRMSEIDQVVEKLKNLK